MKLMKQTKAENDSLMRKFENPKDDVVCPRCGSDLVFKDYVTAWEVFCPKCGIKGTFRGL